VAAHTRAAGVLVCVAALTVGAAAQIGGKPVKGNPTPGTPQPDPPNLADRITLTGCVQVAPARTGAADANAPSSARFVLANAERQNVVPAGTGGSDLTVKTSGRIYKLEGIESQLSPFLGARVQVSGEIKPASSGSGGEREGNAPTLLVEFVQKLTSSCANP
jgi:hypothetical protein